MREALRRYTRAHFGPALAPRLLQGIYALERNWVGPVLGPTGAPTPQINATLALFRAVEADMSPRDRWKWRLQQLMYRANFDAFVQRRAADLPDALHEARQHQGIPIN